MDYLSCIDSDIHDPFKAYQANPRYIDTEIPHIPLSWEKGLKDTANYVISTTNRQPYMVYQQCRFRRNLTYRPCLLANRTL